MTKKTFFLLALALAFALAPSLEAQTKQTTVTVNWQEMPSKISWDGRTLDGMPHRGGPSDILHIRAIKFGRLHGGGDNRVVSILDGNGRETGKTTLDKIQKNAIESGISYIINLSANHRLEISGIGTESGGLVGKKFYVIRGPTKLYINYTDRWPDYVYIDYPSDHDTMVYENWAEYKKEITGLFVDMYILPMVRYSEVKKLYNEVRLQFYEYVTVDTTPADRVRRSNQCPDWLAVGCTCAGDIPRHIIYTTAWKRGLVGGLLEVIPDSFGGFVGDTFGGAFSEEIGDAFAEALGETAEAIIGFEKDTTKIPAVLAATLGYHYGWYPDEETFKSRFRNHAIVLYSKAAFPPAGAGIAGIGLRTLIDLGVDKLGNLLGMTALGKVVNFAIGGITAAWNVSDIGYRADRFFKVSGTVVGWDTPTYTIPEPERPLNWTAVTDSKFVRSINGIAYGYVRGQGGTWVAVGSGGQIAHSDNGARWAALTPPVNSRDPGESSFGGTTVNAVAYGTTVNSPLFVAVGDSGKIAYSPDGKEWTAVKPGTSSRDPGESTFGTSTIHGVAYGNGRWVAVGNGGKIAYSTNGASWTAATNNGGFDANNINAVAYGNGRFVATGGGKKMAYSSNGSSWTAVSNAPSSAISIIYANNRWVAGAGQGNIALSPDGETWRAVPKANNGGFGDNAANNTITGLAFGNNRFVAVGWRGRIAYSADALNWTAVTTANNGGFGGNTHILAVAYGNGRFVAVGQYGKMAYVNW
jgi:hypothetical protein